MAEINLSTMVYMSIVMGMVVIAMLGFVGSLASEYGKSPDLSSINKTVELGEKLQSTYEGFETDEPTTSLLGATGLFITGANVIWTFILLFLSLPDLIGTLIIDFGSAVGVPAIFTGGVSLLLIGVGVFAILRILSKSEV